MHRLWPHGDPSVVARRILAEPAYRHLVSTTAAKPADSIWQLIWDWLVKHVFEPLFGPIVHAGAASRGVGTLLGIVLIVAAVGALAFVVFRLAVAFVRTAKPAGRALAPSTALDGDEFSARAWREVAREAMRRGDFAAAIAALFAAARRVLDERDAIAFDASRTPGEYVRLVRRDRIANAAEFDSLTGAFVRARYGEATSTAADAADAERAFTAFAPEVGA